MDRVEQAVVRQCLRQLMRAEQPNNIGNREALAAALMSLGQGVQQRDALNYTYTANVRQEIWETISEAALTILANNAPKATAFYFNANPEVLRFICHLFLQYRNDNPFVQGHLPLITLHAGRNAKDITQIVFENWSRISKVQPGSLKTGLYQVFRRYKPTREQKTSRNRSHDWSSDENHAVICELLYLNLGKREARMVTGDLNIYYGSLCLTYEDILYGIFQRPADQRGEIHQRFIASRIEGADLGVWSGICVKVGNITTRPIASDIYYLYIPTDQHMELYSVFQEIIDQNWDDRRSISADSVIADYVAITPPIRPRSDPEWQRVRYLRDFPALLKMGLPTEDYIALFREPLRTVGASTLSDIVSDVPIEVFRHSARKGVESS